MNFQLTSEQQQLQDSVRRFVERECAFGAAPRAWSRDRWQRIADNGWLAAALPEDSGGLGWSVIETALIGTELGRGLVVEPYTACAVLAAQTLAAAASPEQRQRLLPALGEGSRCIALAHAEPEPHGDVAAVSTRAIASEDGYELVGCKSLVLGAQAADTLLVSARLQEDNSLEGGGRIALFEVPADAARLKQHPLRLHDDTGAAEIVLEGVHVGRQQMIGTPGLALAALRHGHAHAIASLCAELVGAMDKAIELTVQYVKIRHQFGVAIGSFQVLQHRIADMAAECELARSMLYVLLSSILNDKPGERDYTVSQAKSLICRAARMVCGQAIQLHGGIGMTEECQVGHYFKRAVVAEVLFGTSDLHEAKCADTLKVALCA